MKTNTKPLKENQISIRAEEKGKKISLRQSFLNERTRIKEELGDLESIRLKLGLSQRKICILLMVDPSAWTRWNKSEAPPHIYQALKWLLELRKLNPAVTNPSDLSSRVDFIQNKTQSKIKDLELETQDLHKQIESMRLQMLQFSILKSNPETPKKFSKRKPTLKPKSAQKVKTRNRKRNIRKKVKKTPVKKPLIHKQTQSLKKRKSQKKILKRKPKLKKSFKRRNR